MEERKRKGFKIVGKEILQKLGADKEVISEFVNYNRVSQSVHEREEADVPEFLYTDFILKRQLNTIKELEKDDGCYVFHIVAENDFEYYLMATDEDLRSREYRNGLKDSKVFCYVINIRNKDFNGFENVKLYSESGVLTTTKEVE